MSPGFKYRPLSLAKDSTEIRIIELLPRSEFSETIACHISHAHQSENAVFEALSYVLGPQTPSFTILCEDGHFSIGKNLFEVLQRLRLADESNDVEKSQQVQMMRRIYERSKRTIIWLGDSEDGVELAFSLIPKLLMSMSLMVMNRDGRSVTQMLPSEVTAYQVPGFDGKLEEFGALKKILDRPWFQRVWIIQEAAMAADVQILCGPHAISWDEFLQGMAFIGRIGLEFIFTNMGGTCSTWPMIGAVRLMAQKNVDIPLLQLLWLSKESLATDPRDRVFALCGLACDASEPGLNVKIDYSPSYSAYDVFLETAISMLNQSRSLEILSVPRRLDGSILSNSQHSCQIGLPTIKSMLYKKTIHFSASKSSELDIPIAFNTKRLSLSGIFVDSIEKLGPTANFGKSNSGAEKLRRDAERTLSWVNITGANSNALYKNGEACLDAFWQTFYGGHYGVSYEDAKSIFYEHYGFMKRSQLWVQLGISNYFSLFNAMTKLDAVIGYLTGGWKNINRHHVLMAVQRYRRMGISSTGYFVLAPSIAELGDCVFLLKGGNVPFLLRPMAGGVWELIGEVYVHGIMKGEAWAESHCETVVIA